MPREIKSSSDEVEEGYVDQVIESKSSDGKHLISFKESTHYYKMFLNGDPKGFRGIGVTTFTKSGHPTSNGLIIWGKDNSAKHILASLTVPGDKGLMPRSGFFPITPETVTKLIKEGRDAGDTAAQEAADIGTICHGYAELHSVGKLEEAEALLDSVRSVAAWPLIESCVRKYKEWAATNQGSLVMAEAVTGYVCPMHRGLDTADRECTCFCGKFDRLDRVNGKLRIRDYKTSKDIFLDQFIQLGAYKAAIQTWQGLKVEELEVLRFGKDDGTFDTMLISDPKEIEDFQKQALRCRRTYNFLRYNNDPRWKWEPQKKS